MLAGMLHIGEREDQVLVCEACRLFVPFQFPAAAAKRPSAVDQTPSKKAKPAEGTPAAKPTPSSRAASAAVPASNERGIFPPCKCESSEAPEERGSIKGNKAPTKGFFYVKCGHCRRIIRWAYENPDGKEPGENSVREVPASKRAEHEKMFKMKADELHVLCRNLGLQPEGTKPVLQCRLDKYYRCF